MISIFAKRTLRLGIINIWRHRLRSILTILGVVFGVASFIAMLAVGEGASYEAQEQIKQLGSLNIIVKSVKPPQSEDIKSETDRMSEYGLTHADARQISSIISGVEVVVPSRSIRADVVYRTKRIDANAIATLPIFPLISNRKIRAGRFFNEIELADKRNVCVLNAGLARRLFPLEDPIGKAIRVRGDSYEVIGIIEDAASIFSDSSEKLMRFNLYIPITAARSRFGEIIVTRREGNFNIEKVELHEIIVKVEDVDTVMATAQIIRDMLTRTHKKNDYEIIVPLELLKQSERTKRIFNIVLGSIAAISLLVGGIGIMNIMLATVTERTREIGIRRALGARKSDIIIQFMIETVLLSSCGGTIGLALGVILPSLVTRFSGMETIIRLWSLICAFGISALIGLIFGIYPAYRAAAMSPITALRHE